LTLSTDVLTRKKLMQFSTTLETLGSKESEGRSWECGVGSWESGVRSWETEMIPHHFTLFTIHFTLSSCPDSSYRNIRDKEKRPTGI